MKQTIRIVSGGQTGVDRAAFDFALANKIEIGGFIPRNRLAEDGEIPLKYPHLVETATDEYAARTELNVIISDATLIISQGELVGGSHITRQFAEKHQKPFLHVNFCELTIEQAVKRTRAWLASIDCRTLNVAGSRASEDDQIYAITREFLSELFDWFLFSYATI